mmetsp:Transcript_5720/g.21657  ORF Transcript_5720/g.21657 Transcript_5720/m.21657 type:complete len:511 (-) Transcript_5720:2471-4003(-)
MTLFTNNRAPKRNGRGNKKLTDDSATDDEDSNESAIVKSITSSQMHSGVPKPKARWPRGDSRKKSLPFTKREIKFLHKGVLKFGTGAWEKIVKEFDFQEGRTAVSCRKKYLYVQDNPPKTLESESDDDSFPESKRTKKPIAFTKQEVEFIWDGVQTFGTNWRKILKSYRFHPGRSAKSLEHKYYRHIKKNPPKRVFKVAASADGESIPTGKFSDEECQYLLEGAHKYLDSMDRDEAWERILREYAFEDGRTADDLREKYKFIEAQRTMNVNRMTAAKDQTDGGSLPIIPGVPNVTPGRRTPNGRSPYGGFSDQYSHTRSHLAQSNPLAHHGGTPVGMDGPQFAQKYAMDPHHDALSLHNPTPMTPLSPSQVLDEIHIGGSRIPTHSSTSNPSSATTPQPVADMMNQMLQASIQDDSDYESDYEDYDPAPANQLPTATPVAIFVPNPADGLGSVILPMGVRVPILGPSMDDDNMSDDEEDVHRHANMHDVLEMGDDLEAPRTHHPLPLSCV